MSFFDWKGFRLLRGGHRATKEEAPTSAPAAPSTSAVQQGANHEVPAESRRFHLSRRRHRQRRCRSVEKEPSGRLPPSHHNEAATAEAQSRPTQRIRQWARATVRIISTCTRSESQAPQLKNPPTAPPRVGRGSNVPVQPSSQSALPLPSGSGNNMSVNTVDMLEEEEEEHDEEDPTPQQVMCQLLLEVGADGYSEVGSIAGTTNCWSLDDELDENTVRWTFSSLGDQQERASLHEFGSTSRHIPAWKLPDEKSKSLDYGTYSDNNYVVFQVEHSLVQDPETVSLHEFDFLQNATDDDDDDDGDDNNRNKTTDDGKIDEQTTMKQSNFKDSGFNSMEKRLHFHRTQSTEEFFKKSATMPLTTVTVPSEAAISAAAATTSTATPPLAMDLMTSHQNHHHHPYHHHHHHDNAQRLLVASAVRTQWKECAQRSPEAHTSTTFRYREKSKSVMGLDSRVAVTGAFLLATAVAPFWDSVLRSTFVQLTDFVRTQVDFEFPLSAARSVAALASTVTTATAASTSTLIRAATSSSSSSSSAALISPNAFSPLLFSSFSTGFLNSLFQPMFEPGVTYFCSTRGRSLFFSQFKQFSFGRNPPPPTPTMTRS